MNRRLLLLSLLLVVLGSITACQPTTTIADNSELGIGGSDSGSVSPRFREFYETHGGKKLLGIAISPLFTNNVIEYQYTSKVLMAYNLSAERSRQFYFAPIGVELGVAEPPTDPGAPGGHKIYQGFIGAYERLGGSRLTGLPLTEVRYNEERGGVEQYFENLGMYQLESEPNTVYLINYGAWMCASVCDFNSDARSNVMESSVVNQPFVATTRLNPTFTGKPLTEQYVATDGRVEQIFENMVVVEASDRPGGIALRPITAMLGVSGQPSAQIDVPAPLLEMINENTGLELSGLPVTPYTRQSDEVYRQCFVNLCMDYFPNKPEDLQVRPTPLGYLYKNRYFQGGSAPTPVGQKITLRVILGYNLVDPDQSQIITVFVYNNDQPYADIRPTLNLMLPGGKTQSIAFPATGSNGRSSLQLEPISAAHGTRVDIQVCALSGACLDDYFLVWGDP
ncbi:MAG: hypothetical protein ISR58_20690 [Anaerolineales bacterium]|nr:hypothetical protein [Anaerolineales bacterium]